MNVLVERDSIGTHEAPGAPRVRRFEVPPATTVLEFLERVRDAHVLPAAPGGRATWIAEGDRPLAILTQEYLAPWTLLPATTRLVEVAGALPRPHLLLRYLERENPEEAFRRLGGDPVRLGRDAFKPSREIDWPSALRDFFRAR